jgi:hypothetical protein
MTDTQPPAVRIHPDGTVTLLADASYETICDGVGGWIEAAPTDGRIVIWVNEEGKIKDLAFNPLGQRLWAAVDSYGCIADGDWLAGPCVITGPSDTDGGHTPVPAWVLPTLQLLAATTDNRPAPATDPAANSEGEPT